MGKNALQFRWLKKWVISSFGVKPMNEFYHGFNPKGGFSRNSQDLGRFGREPRFSTFVQFHGEAKFDPVDASHVVGGCSRRHI